MGPRGLPRGSLEDPLAKAGPFGDTREKELTRKKKGVSGVPSPVTREPGLWARGTRDKGQGSRDKGLKDTGTRGQDKRHRDKERRGIKST